jgi:Rnl2 family RNA ligase
MSMFKRYESINNANSKDGKEMLENYGDLMGVSMEKAHGAHFSIQTNGKETTCARRSSILEEGDKFFNHVKLLSELENRMVKVYELVQKLYPDVKSIQVDGELIGGLYNHKDVKSDSACAKIQSGVYYCPDHNMYAYDIHCFGDTTFYIDYDVMIDIFEKVSLTYAKPIKYASLNELSVSDNMFNSLIPKMFGLPDIDNNIVEGIVIRPINEQIDKYGNRVILKSKNEKFTETLEPGPSVKKVKNNDLDERISNMITVNRFNNVISKIGEVTKKDFGRLINEFAADIITDFEKEYPDVHNSFNEDEYTNIKRMVKERCIQIVKAHFGY